MSQDIDGALLGWEFKPGEVQARQVQAGDVLVEPAQVGLPERPLEVVRDELDELLAGEVF